MRRFTDALISIDLGNGFVVEIQVTPFEWAGMALQQSHVFGILLIHVVVQSIDISSTIR